MFIDDGRFVEVTSRRQDVGTTLCRGEGRPWRLVGFEIKTYW